MLILILNTGFALSANAMGNCSVGGEAVELVKDIQKILTGSLELWIKKKSAAKSSTRTEKEFVDSFFKNNNKHLRDHFTKRLIESEQGDLMLDAQHSVFKLNEKEVVDLVEEGLNEAVAIVKNLNVSKNTQFQIENLLEREIVSKNKNIVIKPNVRGDKTGLKVLFRVPQKKVGANYQTPLSTIAETDTLAMVISNVGGESLGKLISLYPVNRWSLLLLVPAKTLSNPKAQASAQELFRYVNETALDIVDWSVEMKVKQIEENKNKIWDVLGEFAFNLLLPLWAGAERTAQDNLYTPKELQEKMSIKFSFLDHQKEIIESFEKLGLHQCTEDEYFIMFMNMVKPVVESAVPFEILDTQKVN